MGVPVVASDNRGTREYMQDGVNGFVYRLGDAEGLIRGVERVSRMTAGELEAMGLEGRRTAERFGLGHTDRIMRDVYRRVCREVCSAVEDSGKVRQGNR